MPAFIVTSTEDQLVLGCSSTLSTFIYIHPYIDGRSVTYSLEPTERAQVGKAVYFVVSSIKEKQLIHYDFELKFDLHKKLSCHSPVTPYLKINVLSYTQNIWKYFFILNCSYLV